MKHFGKRLSALAVSFGLCLGLTPAFGAESPTLYHFEKSKSYTEGQFADVPTDAWFATGVETAYRLGLLNGKGENSFDPTGNITVIETVTLAARLHKTYYEGSSSFESSDPWYQVYWDYAVKNGIVTADRLSALTAPATRAVFAEILGNALPDEALAVKNVVEDGMIPDIPAGSEYEAAVYRLYRAGILTGSDGAGSFLPENTITRAEVAAIAARMAVESERKTVTLTADTSRKQFRIYPNSRVVVDGIVHLCDILEKDGKWYLSAADAKTALNAVTSEDFVELDGYAKGQNIRYQQDTVMTAAYFSTYLGYDGTAGKYDFDRAIELGLAEASWAAKKNEALTSTQFRSILAYFIRQVAPDKLDQFYANVTDYEQEIDRETGFMMAFYAAQCVGVDYFNIDMAEETTGDSMYLDFNGEIKKLLPNLGSPVSCCYQDQDSEEWVWDNYVAAGCLWAIWYGSPLTGARVFDIDENLDMQNHAPLTAEAAVNAVMRMYDGIPTNTLETVSVTDSLATTPDSSVITDRILAKAATAPAVTADNHPEWTGVMISGQESSGQLNTNIDLIYGGSENLIRTMADWGFNSVRVWLDYDAFFNEDVTEAYPTTLKELDRYVAAAVQNNLHLTLCMYSLPGRTQHHSTEDYTSTGDFDLYINESKWATANRVWETIAKRYADIPSAYLSFMPTPEVGNYNLSTGLEYTEYRGADVGRYVLSAIDTIRAVDPDRLIIQEAGGYGGEVVEEKALIFTQEIIDAVSQRDNVLIDHNFNSNAYSYANMTDTEGEHIDNNNHSFYLVDYPTYWYELSPYIIDTTAFPLESIEEGWNIDREDTSERTLSIDSPLPAGTQIELYLSFSITNDSLGDTRILFQDGTGKTVYEEVLSEAFYTEGEPISRYIRYRESDKKITFTLTDGVDSLKISARNGWFGWTGMKLTLPEEYAVEKWYCATAYDVFLGLEEEEGIFRKSSHEILLWSAGQDAGHHATLTDNLTFTSEVVDQKADEETIRADVEQLVNSVANPSVRTENCYFYAVTQGDLLRYQEDQLSIFAEYGVNWYKLDWEALAGKKQYAIAGGEYADYNGACEQIYPALLRLLQKYQNIER